MTWSLSLQAFVQIFGLDILGSWKYLLLEGTTRYLDWSILDSRRKFLSFGTTRR